MEKFLMGIDVGTSTCKVAVFASDGRVVAQSSKPYNIYYPAPGYVEQNPEEWWESIREAVKETIHVGEIDPKQIAGIGIAGQSWSAIPINSEGIPLSNTPIWMDTRSSEICSKVTEKIGLDRIFNISGNLFEPTYSTPKILWFKEKMPDIFKNTYKFLQSNSYIAFKLTGVVSQDVSQGYGLHFFNMKSGKWDDKLCDEIGIPMEKLPDIYKCHQVIGEVTASAAEATGLVSGIPVVAGGLDAACGTLGAGVVDIGQTQEQGGQAGGMSICTSEALSHRKLILSFHVVPDLWLLQGGTVGGSGTMRWFRQELAGFEVEKENKTGISAFKYMDEEAALVSAGSDGLIFLPYMAGERSPLWDKHAKGVFFGLGFDKTRAHMIRSTMEGCAFALIHNLRTAEETGIKIDELVTMGGAANSRIWTQIKADATGKIIKVPGSDTATTLGAAILAGVGTGIYKDFKEAVKSTVRITRVHEPNMETHNIYMKYYEIYLELYEKLKDVMFEVSNLEKYCK